MVLHSEPSPPFLSLAERLFMFTHVHLQMSACWCLSLLRNCRLHAQPGGYVFRSRRSFHRRSGYWGLFGLTWRRCFYTFADRSLSLLASKCDVQGYNAVTNLEHQTDLSGSVCPWVCTACFLRRVFHLTPHVSHGSSSCIGTHPPTQTISATVYATQLHLSQTLSCCARTWRQEAWQPTRLPKDSQNPAATATL